MGLRTGGGLFSPRRLSTVVVAAGLLGCGDGPLAVSGTPSQTLSIQAGRQLELTFQTVGPGQYASPPAVGSAAVRFLSMEVVTPAVPAGVTQQFRFAAVRPGVAVIVFHHTTGGPTIEDTVQVH